MEIIHDPDRKTFSMINQRLYRICFLSNQKRKARYTPYRSSLSNRRTRSCITTGKSGVRLCYKQSSQTVSNLQLCHNLVTETPRIQRSIKKGYTILYTLIFTSFMFRIIFPKTNTSSSFYFSDSHRYHFRHNHKQNYNYTQSHTRNRSHNHIFYNYKSEPAYRLH